MKYVTVKGDTLKSIAEKFDTNTNTIKELNPELPRIKVGMEIEVPDLEIEEDEVINIDDDNDEEITVKEIKAAYFVCTKKGGNLNVRKEPDGEIVNVIENGSKVEVIEFVDGWAKIKDGYVRQDLIKEE